MARFVHDLLLVDLRIKSHRIGISITGSCRAAGDSKSCWMLADKLYHLFTQALYPIHICALLQQLATVNSEISGQKEPSAV
ncbi:hypothetical protein FKG94_07410 [Exilibacterium tricleocarpae]|uniref:Uncharacterized protein n=1 Tax=Exilibacterium tricleocarpae TaxID=2591008 RepID=A0A545TZA2_9GAMM|nr:hypothetical protein [Exilibacterium tricleocarpae]TQV82552.1 hypothetical protein FKG94_07410 [Exilibacterium tricleocarpae]